MENFDYIRRNLSELRDELCYLAAKEGASAPTLVAVTKSGSDDELLALVRAGAADIGENRPGEVLRRGELIRAAGLCARMHEIGTLQRNKVKLIASTAHMVHSLDSERLARDINRHAEAMGRVIPVLIEINSAKEPQKSGVMPEDAERLICEISDYKSIEVKGLMTMGPAIDDQEGLRIYFRQTKKLFDDLNSRYQFGEGATLSMGMSDSYRVAIEEGSTLVRIGRRLFKK